eukprot:COSAG02_NODE_2053_length_9994_cov_7.402628_9_plen_60_part_00
MPYVSLRTNFADAAKKADSRRSIQQTATYEHHLENDTFQSLANVTVGARVVMKDCLARS